MKRSGEGTYNERWEARERERLPDNLRACWDKAANQKILRRLPFKHVGSRNTAKALFREAPATRATLLSRTNRLLHLAASAGLPAGFNALLNPAHLDIIFKTTGARLRGRTKWSLCTALWRMAWELRNEAAGWILVGGRRYRRKDDGKIRPVDPQLPDRVRARAREMHLELPRVANLSKPQAIKLRTAAHAMLAAELGARLSEIALPKMHQFKNTSVGLVMLLDAAHSKMAVAGRELILDETATLLQDYIKRGRCVLLRGGGNESTQCLWITKVGLDAESHTMAATFSRAMKDLRPDGVCCTDLRRSLQSQEGQTFAEMARRARHAPGSSTGPIIYTGRDRAKAVACGIALSNLKESDVPSFEQPAPTKRKA